MENKINKYYNFILKKLVDNTEYNFIVLHNHKYVDILTPNLKYIGEESYVCSKNNMNFWVDMIGCDKGVISNKISCSNLWNYRYLSDTYGLTILEYENVVCKYIRIITDKILMEWDCELGK